MPGTAEMLNNEITAQAEAFDAIFAQDFQYDALWEQPLEVTVERQLHVTLCYGGPTVEAIADLDDDGSVTDAHLEGWWGSEHQIRPVYRDSKLWDALEFYAEGVLVDA